MFSNFKNKLSKSITKNELTIKKIENLTTQNGIIEPLYDTELFVSRFIPKNDFDLFYFNNASLLNNTIRLEVYEYFDINTNSLKNRLFAVNKSFELYEYQFDSKSFISCYVTFSKFPKIIHHDGLIYFIDNQTSIMFENDNAPIVLTTLANLQHFALCENKIIFSTKDAPFDIFYTELTPLYNIHSNLENCYSLTLAPEDGKVLNITILNEKLYVIQEHKISKIAIKNNEATLSITLQINAKILTNTAKNCNNYIVFCTKDALFAFNGNSCNRLFDEIFQNINFENPESVVFENKYYLKANDELLIEFDIEKEVYNLFKLNGIQNIYTMQSASFYNLCLTKFDELNYSILALHNNKLTSKNKQIVFNKISFDTNDFKVLKEIKFIGVGECDVCVKSDIESLSFHLTANTKMSNITICGNVFELIFEGVANFLIEAIFVKILNSSDEYE